ncbi:heavy metal translocating P-type ATPase [Sphingopyxis sp.]|jgi:Cu2+-exporting ATPase|uniref:heavy metal translocating P-type ATPase n=1 Tax=Sphingopyxis sp. TaxID=1908224 RepID=UPI002E092827|nr:heavy metal translocating P-type ATPase [Sphingopyxis sp.]
MTLSAVDAVDFAAVDLAVLAHTRLTVPGIRCAGCIAKIERGLRNVKGVDGARVNFSAKRVTVTHDRALDAEALIAALEKLGFEAQTSENNSHDQSDIESRILLRSVAVAGFGMMNIMLLSVSVWSGAGGVTRDLFHWLSGMIAIPVVAYAGRPFFASAVLALRHRRTNMDVPISIGVLLATGLSVYETLTGGEHAYFDSAVMLLFFLLVGRALDSAMRGRTRAGIGSLLSRMGKSARVVAADGTTYSVPAKDLDVGMVMLVAAGEALAADGVLEDGRSTIDNSMLTGESIPQAISADDLVYAGAINVSDPIRVRVTAASSDTVIAEIAQLMDEAGQSRSHYVRIADRASRLYAPVVHTLALSAFVGWMIAGLGLHQSLVIAIAVLIITCPCAMGLAVPAAHVVASGALAKRGLLVKDGSALERLAEVDIALFDKTGTLTLGQPVPELDHLSNEQKSIALTLAQSSRHPLSRGLARALGADGILPATVSSLSEKGGEGISGSWVATRVALERADVVGSGLSTTLRIGEDRIAIPFADPMRPDAIETIHALQACGIDSRIVSGDRALSVSAVASELGVVGQGELRPDAKLALLDTLKAQGRRPLMIGDGINDGPALAAAHASISPSSGSDISQQAADAVFIGRGLMPVALAVIIARRTMRIVRQNFGFAIAYNVFAVPLAIAGLLTPLIAAIAMSLSSLVVVGNSLRLARNERARPS